MIEKNELTKEERIAIIEEKNRKTLEVIESIQKDYDEIKSLIDESRVEKNKITKFKNMILKYKK